MTVHYYSMRRRSSTTTQSSYMPKHAEYTTAHKITVRYSLWRRKMYATTQSDYTRCSKQDTVKSADNNHTEMEDVNVATSYNYIHSVV